MTHVNPAILTWARETAGLALPEAAQKVGLRDTRQGPGAQRLAALEAGEGEVSRPTLLKMAQVYRRPLITFYLAKPPPKADRGEDFRTLPDDQRADAAGAVDALVRDIRARQGVVRALLEDEDASSLGFVASRTLNDGIAGVTQAVREAISFNLSEFRAQRTTELAFNYLRRQAEAAGVFVLLIGNLGSHHSAIDVEAFRGFALADEIAPFVVINDQDAKSAWAFTLLHELAHVILGQTGISGGSMEARMERFCNDVASALLLPADELAGLDVRNADLAAVQQRITEFATGRHISRALVAYRLRLVGALTEERWRTVSGAFRNEYLRDRDERRQRERASEGGPNYYVVRRHKLGGALLQLVRRTLDEGTLTPTKAGKILGVHPRNVEPLVAGGAS
ncbi:MAG: ImmA/IrrE family metallo-endopeptidase [Phenylobacterium sp.]|jgi:Zn-dependent peptidase ImmA (M78 family)|nr:ImmA/IrrE family metallo-endopeptidase [Phenylobacterium sp.]MDZ4318906.1 ImmA/IrrE family metallo-endopeptidase [Phenylobacterium sp.]